MAVDPRIAGLMQPALKKGRPPGSKTRPDSPRMIAKRQRAERIAREKASRTMNNPPPTNPTPPAPAPAPAPARPDTDLFSGGMPDFDNPPSEKFAGGTPGPDPSPIPDDTQANQTPPPDYIPPDPAGEKHRPLVTMLWQTAVNLLAVLIGPFWSPRKKGDNTAAGEIPFDESEMVVAAACEYCEAVGMMVMTPAQKFWLAVTAYSTPRFIPTLAVLKEKFTKRKPRPAQPPGDSRFAGGTETPANPLKPDHSTGAPEKNVVAV